MRQIITLPDERLRLAANAVTEFDQQLQALYEELEAAMRAGEGGVGIAATQIGEQQQLVIIDCSTSQRPCENHGLLCLINPEIEVRGAEATLGREGCLSVPDWVGMVPRAKHIRVRYQNLSGEHQSLKCSGFEARVIQHEVDHLYGRLFIDRVISTHDLVRRS
ncbi:MAG: peptide deformylase [Mariprofundaceae bacterium]